MKYASIIIHYDSLAEAYGFPEKYQDPAFHEVADLFMKIADKYNFRYSIFVLGKDLEKAENRKAVRGWHENGHEIGNHSWSHPLNIGTLPEEELYEEVRRTDEIIKEVTGLKPVGFVAPGWNVSPQLLEALIRCGYKYDLSSFPSWLIYPALLRLLTLNIGSHRLTKILKRRDYLTHWFAPRQAYYTAGQLSNQHDPGSVEGKNIYEIPLPTNRFRIACWHTTLFLLGWEWHRRLMESCLSEIEHFCYTLHPGDLITHSNLDPKRKARTERINYSLDYKFACIEKSIQTILESGREIVPVRETLQEKFFSPTEALTRQGIFG
jgi:peptidoglycan/xylan/chitin deacetylase (PgdA/CDA1 family)